MKKGNGVGKSFIVMKTINIAEILLSPDLGSRAQARGFRRFVDDYFSGEAVTIDFSGVQFSSRAFMDEFYNLFLAPAVLSESRVGVDVEVVNMPDDIAAILASVVRTNTHPRVASSSNVEVPVREFKIEENPSVGIFWYDSGSHSLFGVRRQEVTPAQIETAACDGLPFIIYPETNEEVWQQEKFPGDYARIPRGRVSWVVNRFVVLVGSWARPIEDELTVLLQSEFSLPSLELVYDGHWDVV